MQQENNNINRLLEQNKGYLQDSAMEMNKTRDEIRKLRVTYLRCIGNNILIIIFIFFIKFKLYRQEFDSEVSNYKKENDELRSQIETYKTQIFSFKDQDEAILKVVDERINEFKVIL